jgi:spore coat polysaccharide biosynthesis protein SpsF
MEPLVVVQARTGSTRLPGKVLLPLAGRPLLQRMLERVQAATSNIVVATTWDSADEPVRALCAAMGVRCFSGHPTDLLDRHYGAACAFGATDVVKIPSDCPLVDPGVIRTVLDYYRTHCHGLDYASNLHPASYPDGNDVEVMKFSVLQEAWREAEKAFEREHTTPFIWERPLRYRIGNVVWDSGQNLSMSHRWTIDYPEDYEFVTTVYDELWSQDRPVFNLQDILDLLTSRPEIARINARYAGVNWYRHHAGELHTVSPAEFRAID